MYVCMYVCIYVSKYMCRISKGGKKKDEDLVALCFFHLFMESGKETPTSTAILHRNSPLFIDIFLSLLKNP